MKVLYTKSFDKDLESIQHDADIKQRLTSLIEDLKKLENIYEIKTIKKIEGYPNYFRIKISDFRLGFKVVNNELELIRFLHRKDIYRRFP
ncbi:MAG: type II toxin-antitoxin system RelE/ParE family toxin [Pseudomonadota bacterium]